MSLSWKCKKILYDIYIPCEQNAATEFVTEVNMTKFANAIMRFQSQMS